MLKDNNHYKILIVDDIPSNIQLLGNMLREEKFDVAFSTSGEDALRKIKTIEFDLILLDIMMPEMNGFEVCKAIKNDDHSKDIPIIFLTAKNDTESVVKGFEMGAVDYITKPFNYKELFTRIKTHLMLKGQKQLIESMNQLLEKRVSERTQKLKEANARLLKLDNAKVDFLTLINHELRTPLSGITGYVDLLANHIKSLKEEEYIKKLRESVKELTRLIEIALLIASLRSDKYKMNTTRISINELITQLLNKTKKQALDKSLNISPEFLQNDEIISVDHKLILICLSNILSNAIRYSPHKSIIKIKYSNEEDYISIAIIDEGPGFSDLTKEKLFDFFQTDDITHHAKGFGLGLAVSKLIMDAHLGKLEIENNLFEGATVRIKIPKLEKND